MTDESRLTALLKSAIPPVTDLETSQDLWPLVTRRPQQVVTWSRIDLGIVAVAMLVVAAMPQAWLLVAYHF